jgi:hypothetical protein
MASQPWVRKLLTLIILLNLASLSLAACTFNPVLGLLRLWLTFWTSQRPRLSVNALASATAPLSISTAVETAAAVLDQLAEAAARTRARRRSERAETVQRGCAWTTICPSARERRKRMCSRNAFVCRSASRVDVEVHVLTNSQGETRQKIRL